MGKMTPWIRTLWLDDDFGSVGTQPPIVHRRYMGVLLT